MKKKYNEILMNDLGGEDIIYKLEKELDNNIKVLPVLLKALAFVEWKSKGKEYSEKYSDYSYYKYFI